MKTYRIQAQYEHDPDDTVSDTLGVTQERDLAVVMYTAAVTYSSGAGIRLVSRDPGIQPPQQDRVLASWRWRVAS